MKPDNANFSSDNRPCAPAENPLIRGPVGDVLQGAASDCNSGEENDDFLSYPEYLALRAKRDNTPGQTENASGTLTTRLVPFDPSRQPPPDADMSFIDPPNYDEPEEDRLPLLGWLLPCAVLGALLLAWGVWG